MTAPAKCGDLLARHVDARSALSHGGGMVLRLSISGAHTILRLWAPVSTARASDNSATELLLIVPFEKTPRRSMERKVRGLYLRSVEWVVAPTILIVLAQAGTDDQSQLRCDGDIAGIEEAM